MSKTPTACPISNDHTDEPLTNGDYRDINCPTCGQFKISGTLIATLPNNPEIDTNARAVLSHYIRQKNEAGAQPFFSGNMIDKVIEEFSLPGPAEQADNLILYLGRNTTVGKMVQFSIPALTASIGALDSANSMFVCQHLFKQHYIMHDHQDLIFTTNNLASLGLHMKVETA